jgi:hypothetical protein
MHADVTLSVTLLGLCVEIAGKGAWIKSSHSTLLTRLWSISPSFM